MFIITKLKFDNYSNGGIAMSFYNFTIFLIYSQFVLDLYYASHNQCKQSLLILFFSFASFMVSPKPYIGLSQCEKDEKKYIYIYPKLL